MDYNMLIEREKQFVDDISNRYHYDSNIRHLLYIIVPAFIIKYGTRNEKLILNAFRDTEIINSNQESKTVKAYYSSFIQQVNMNYVIHKHIVIQNYHQISLVDLLDNLVHEFNHAINSYNYGIKEVEQYLYLRTGLTYGIYLKKDLSFIKKDPSFMLEEIINTKQTEEIINIIKSFDLTNTTIANTIYAINSETAHQYNSHSYYLEGYICKEILNNKTFIRTLENLRLKGEVYDIEDWFDAITDQKGSYEKLITLLHKIYQLELAYSNKKLFKRRLIYRIKSASNEVCEIIERFNTNVNYR